MPEVKGDNASVPARKLVEEYCDRSARFGATSSPFDRLRMRLNCSALERDLMLILSKHEVRRLRLSLHRVSGT